MYYQNQLNNFPYNDAVKETAAVMNEAAKAAADSVVQAIEVNLKTAGAGVERFSRYAESLQKARAADDLAKFYQNAREDEAEAARDYTAKCRELTAQAGQAAAQVSDKGRALARKNAQDAAAGIAKALPGDNGATLQNGVQQALAAADLMADTCLEFVNKVFETPMPAAAAPKASGRRRAK